ncbi:MAG TPA: D-aminoacylase [Woeseiaceae bacterium]|nr:D-aminoacylase [Woeseiaceae bacterium]
MNWVETSRRTFCGLLAAGAFGALILLGACGEQEPPAATSAAEGRIHDVVIRGGTVYDGLGGEPVSADVAIDGDRIAAIGELADARGQVEVDATGLAVAPGFINMLSWAVGSLVEDGRAQSDVRQGVTLEVFGEGESWGPWNDSLKQVMKEGQGDIRYDIEWTTLGEYLEFLENKGVSVNVASFVGATTVRENVIGFEDRDPTQPELEEMQALVRQAMEEGALGVGSSLIYAPAFYAKTPELVALAKTAAEYDGMYISHMRSEGNKLLEAVDELLQIAREANIRAEIYHLKAAGRDNWSKLDQVFEKVDAARAEGLEITADIYPYTAGATGLDAAMPPWVQEGGTQQWIERLKDPEIRERVIEEMKTPSDEWENLYLAAGADKLIVIGFKNPDLKRLTGKTLAEVAEQRGTSPEEAAIDLVIEDGSRVGTVYFLMSEENIGKKVQKEWVSVGSDADARAPEGVFLDSNPHPRAYGTFARFLGNYVRDEQLISLQEGIRRLTSLPAGNLRIEGRGSLQAGNFADVVVFDPDAIKDNATYENPHVYSSGVLHVFVNGEQVLEDGEHTGATPGRVVRGPGWRGEVEPER